MLYFSSLIPYIIACSAFIISNSTSHEVQIKTIKPNNFNQITEIAPCPLWSSEKKNEINSFINKREYLNQRPSIIKYIKNIYIQFSLSLKTYFLSVAYLDKICSKISSFNINYLLHVCILCIILASKFNENPEKALEVQTVLKSKIDVRYSSSDHPIHMIYYKIF